MLKWRILAMPSGWSQHPSRFGVDAHDGTLIELPARKMETFQRIAWALRKTRLPVARDGLVLDVGAGACPYPRADVLLERYVKGFHRGGTSVVADRPIVFADALKMPFKDKAFDFIVASHVLEHITKPEVFLDELMRVGKAGYIETPNVLLERLCAYPIHVLDVMDCDGKLIIRKKPTEGSEDFLARLKLYARHPKWHKFFYGVPQMFHVRYFWKDMIEYEIDNADETCSWGPRLDEEQAGDVVGAYEGQSWRTTGLRLLRRYYAWRRRAPVDWLSILACPVCHGSLTRDRTTYVCNTCDIGYSADPHPDFLEPLPLQVLQPDQA